MVSSISGNTYEVIGVTESFPVQNNSCIDWKHFLVIDTHILNESNPDIECINKVYVKTHINNVRIIETSIKFEEDYIRNEGGYISPGRNILVEGIICITVLYTANSEIKTVHSISYTIPFSDYIALENSYAYVNEAKYTVNLYVEGAFVTLPIDERSLYTTVSLYMTAQPDYALIGSIKLNYRDIGTDVYKSDSTTGVLAFKNKKTGKIYKVTVHSGEFKLNVDEPGEYEVNSENTNLKSLYGDDEENYVTLNLNEEGYSTSTVVVDLTQKNKAIEISPIVLNINDADEVTGKVTFAPEGIDEDLKSAVLTLTNKANKEKYNISVNIEGGRYEFKPNVAGDYDANIELTRKVTVGGNTVEQKIDNVSLTPDVLTITDEGASPTQDFTATATLVSLTNESLTVNGSGEEFATIVFLNTDGILEVGTLTKVTSTTFSYGVKFYNNGIFTPIKLINDDGTEYNVKSDNTIKIIDGVGPTPGASSITVDII